MASKSRTVPPMVKTVHNPIMVGSKRKAATFSEVNILGDFSDDDCSGSSVGKKRKINDDAKTPKPKSPSKKLKLGDTPEEKRLKPFRKRAPQAYLQRLDRVRTQRMFLIDRERKLGRDGTEEKEVFDIAGTTGNIYQVTICKQPKCTCPDNQKGNQCKHIVYVCNSKCHRTHME